MTAKQKIEELTNAWYGFALFGALVSLLQNGIGFFSLFFTAASMCFSIFVTWFLGRRLLARSSLTRVLLVVLSALGVGFGTLGVVWSVFGSWSFSGLVTIALSVASIWMNVRSLRVLTDQSVKTYFA